MNTIIAIYESDPCYDTTCYIGYTTAEKREAILKQLNEEAKLVICPYCKQSKSYDSQSLNELSTT